MTGHMYFSKLCTMEAHLHMIKACNLVQDKTNELKHLNDLRAILNEIFDGCVNEAETKLYVAK